MLGPHGSARPNRWPCDACGCPTPRFRAGNATVSRHGSRWPQTAMMARHPDDAGAIIIGSQPPAGVPRRPSRPDDIAARRKGLMKEAHRKAPDPDDAISFDHLHGRTGRKRFRAARSRPPQLCYGQGDRTVAHAQRLGLRGGRTVTSAVQLKIKRGCHQVCSTPSPHAKRTYCEPQPSGRSALLHVYRLILTVGSHRHAFVEVIPKAAKIIKSNIKYKTGPPCTGDQRAKASPHKGCLPGMSS